MGPHGSSTLRRSIDAPARRVAACGDERSVSREPVRSDARSHNQETTMAAQPDQMPTGRAQDAANDSDPGETKEWLDALTAVVAREGPARAHHLLQRLIETAAQLGADVPVSA